DARRAGAGECRRAGLGGGAKPRLFLAAHPDDLVAPGPDPDQADGSARVVGDRGKVVPGLPRQLGLPATIADVALEARELLVLGLRHVDDRLVVWELIENGSLGVAVADAHPEGVDAAEHVELGHRQRAHAVQADRVGQRDQIEPAGAPRAAGGRSDLAPALPQPLAQVALQLAWEGARADAGRV